jgi:hypothetical protein
MTPEARNWMMLWHAKGRSKLLPIKMFATMPEEFIEELDRWDVVSAFGEKGVTYHLDFVEQTNGVPHHAVTDLSLRTQKWIGHQCRGEEQGNFFKVMDQIRQWTYAELTRPDAQDTQQTG